MFEIVNKRRLNSAVTLLEISAPRVAAKAAPGQFIILMVDKDGERIPLTINDYNRETGTVTIIFQIVGVTTQKLSVLEKGDYISDFVGPLGEPTELDGYSNVCVIAGGVGSAIAYPQAKELNKNGVKVDVVAGFKNKDIVILEDEFRNACTNLYITTDDGSYIQKGFVTDKLKELIESGENYDVVIAIGPIMMMKAISNLTREYNIKTIVSLNPIMIDGTGMCGGCRVYVGGEAKFACVDGPDFDGHLVDFDKLIFRNRLYAPEEKREKEKHEQSTCNLFRGIKDAK